MSNKKSTNGFKEKKTERRDRMENIVSYERLYTFEEIAKSENIPVAALMKLLCNEGYLYEVDGNYLPTKKGIDSGWFAVVF
jgi:phage antirepressor YoqD-like protein